MKKFLDQKTAKLSLLLLLTCCILFYAACHKQRDVDSQKSLSFIENAQKWFKSEVVDKEKAMLASPFSKLPGNHYDRIFARMGKIRRLLKWEEAKESNYEGYTYLVVSTDEGINPFSNKEFEAQRAVVFYKDNEGRMQMEIIEVLSQNGNSLSLDIQEIASASFINKHFNKNKDIQNIDAAILFYNQNYRLENSYELKNGIWEKANIKLVIGKGAVNKRTVASTTARRASCYCETWYLIGYWYSIDTGQIISYHILDQYERCYGEATPPGYGSTPDGTIDQECATAPARLQELSNATVSDEIESIETVQSGTTTRTKKYKWIILKNITGLWRLYSIEKGTHKKVINSDPNKQWEWQSLENQGIGMSGFNVGGSVEYSLISAIPTLGRYYAIMDLDFKVKSSVVCKGSPVASELIYPANRHFNVNE
jgi:hypothetical protein